MNKLVLFVAVVLALFAFTVHSSTYYPEAVESADEYLDEYFDDYGSDYEYEDVAVESLKINGDSVVSTAKKYIGNTYVYGGDCVNGNRCDCSSFTRFIYGKFGVSLPRTSGLQCNGSYGTRVSSLANAQPGDLLCSPGHVMIYAGNGNIVHAANPTSGITTGKASWFNIQSIRRF